MLALIFRSLIILELRFGFGDSFPEFTQFVKFFSLTILPEVIVSPSHKRGASKPRGILITQKLCSPSPVPQRVQGQCRWWSAVHCGDLPPGLLLKPFPLAVSGSPSVVRPQERGAYRMLSPALLLGYRALLEGVPHGAPP